MKMKAIPALFPCLLGMLSLGRLAASDTTTAEKPPPFEIVCRTAGTLTTTSLSGKTVFDIRDKSGIGRAVVRRSTAPWPEEIIVRAHLNGLEHLAIGNGRVKLSVEVGAHQLLHLWQDGKQGPALGKDSPYWIEIRKFDAAGKPVVARTLSGGWFELVIPKALLGEAKELQFDWIDFYR